MTKVTFHFAGQTKTVENADGQSVLKIALDHAIPMEHACGGNGFCTTCLCQVKAGAEHLNVRNDREENMGVTMEPYRLGCQTRVQASPDGTVEIEVNES